ncbi:hypothetical protein ACP87_18925 [Pseudomonas oleovorans]|nr:hypothetical protein JF55_14680 [Pseudomonas sp. 1-7]MBN7119730.1 hypothetical protein [Pseudomonas oleovorans]MBN7141305.1 hypothetical protein [Pseudomonas oleovorans]
MFQITIQILVRVQLRGVGRQEEQFDFLGFDDLSSQPEGVRLCIHKTYRSTTTFACCNHTAGDQLCVNLPVLLLSDRQPVLGKLLFYLTAKSPIAFCGSICRKQRKEGGLEVLGQIGHAKDSTSLVVG